LLATACGAVASYPGTGHVLTVPQLKYQLVGWIGAPLFCGPPVIRVPTPSEAAQEVAALRSQQPKLFEAVAQHEHLRTDDLTYAQDELILQQADRLEHLVLTAQGDLHRFDYIAGGSRTHHASGTIDATGHITLERDDPARFPPTGGCPVCLASWDTIDTPSGPVAITRLRRGDPVWTIDDSGRRIAAPVLRVVHIPAPPGHFVVHLVLADGRSVYASPSHPTADGRRIGALRPGDPLDGALVMATHLVPYVGDTWDLLPAGSAHVYWADGILLKSTLDGAS
jgi:hypothetical protein